MWITQCVELLHFSREEFIVLTVVRDSKGNVNMRAIFYAQSCSNFIKSLPAWALFII